MRIVIYIGGLLCFLYSIFGLYLWQRLPENIGKARKYMANYISGGPLFRVFSVFILGVAVSCFVFTDLLLTTQAGEVIRLLTAIYFLEIALEQFIIWKFETPINLLIGYICFLGGLAFLIPTIL